MTLDIILQAGVCIAKRYDWCSYSNEVKLVPTGSIKMSLNLQQSYYKPCFERIHLLAC
jgi:hypothetical protein